MIAANPKTTYTGLVLAGDRGPTDPVAAATGSRCKALSPVAGTPMVLRVLSALEASDGIGELVLSGPVSEVIPDCPELQAGIDAGRWAWRAPLSSPSRSAGDALAAIDSAAPVLLTTADHALLRPEVVEHFCTAASATGADLAVALVRYDDVMEAFPGTRRTGIRFSDDTYCGCNLFAFVCPESRRAADFWRRIEQDRKKPWRMLRALGWFSVVRYLTGRLSLDQALTLLSRRIGARIERVMLPFPEAAVDVDKPSDHEFVERLVRAEGS